MARVKLLGDFANVPDLPFGHELAVALEERAGSNGGLGGGLGGPVELPPGLEEYQLYGLSALGRFKPVTWLVDHRLAVGESHVLWGKGDSYKSFLALDWSMRLAYAGHIVVYVVAEGASGMVARTSAWKIARGIDFDAPGMLFLPRNVNLHDKRSVARWTEALRIQLGEWFDWLPEARRHPVLVVFDTLARNFVGGDEASPRDMGLFVEGIEAVRRGLGCATLIIHHSDKTGGAERGTESLRNSCFAMFRLTRAKLTVGGSGGGAGGGGYGARLTCDRMKDFERPAPEELKFDVVATDLMVDGAAVTSLAVGADKNSIGAGIFSGNNGDSALGVNGNGSGVVAGEGVMIWSRSEEKVLRWFADRAEDEGVPTGVHSVAEVERGVQLSHEPVRNACLSLQRHGVLGMRGATKSRVYWLQQEVEG